MNKDQELTPPWQPPWMEGSLWSTRDVLRAKTLLINTLDDLDAAGVPMAEIQKFESFYGSQIGQEGTIWNWKDRLALGFERKTKISLQDGKIDLQSKKRMDPQGGNDVE